MAPETAPRHLVKKCEMTGEMQVAWAGLDLSGFGRRHGGFCHPFLLRLAVWTPGLATAKIMITAGSYPSRASHREHCPEGRGVGFLRVP